MVAVASGDVIVVTTAGVASHYTANLGPVQRKDFLSDADRAWWLDERDNHATTHIVGADGVQIDDRILFTTVDLHKVVMTDLEFNPAGDFATIPPAENGQPWSIAYSPSRSLVYVSTRFDADRSYPDQLGSIYAFEWPSGALFGRYTPLPGGSGPDAPGWVRESFSSASNYNDEMCIAISPDENTLYITQLSTNYGIWACAIDPSGNLSTPSTPTAVLNGIQPRHWKDYINWHEDPDGLGGCGYPDTSCLVYPSTPNFFEVLDDGASVGTWPHNGEPNGQSLLGAKVNTGVNHGFYNPGAYGDTRPILTFGQLSFRTGYVEAGSDGRIYAVIYQRAAETNRAIHDYPTTPFHFPVYVGRYSSERRVEAYLPGGGNAPNATYLLPVHDPTDFDVMGYQADWINPVPPPTRFTPNQILGIAVNADSSSIYVTNITQDTVTRWSAVDPPDPNGNAPLEAAAVISAYNVDWNEFSPNPQNVFIVYPGGPPPPAGGLQRRNQVNLIT